MARISDKHGLTNKYRPLGTGKRVVKRGRPRKYLFGAPKSRSKTYNSVSSNITQKESKIIMIIEIAIVGLIASLLLPFLVPLFIGTILILLVDSFLKKRWGLNQGGWSMPASVLWIIVSAIEMVFCMGAVLVLWLDDTASRMPLLISLAAYTILSTLILLLKYRKIFKNKHNKDE